MKRSQTCSIRTGCTVHLFFYFLILATQKKKKKKKKNELAVSLRETHTPNQ